MWKNTVWCICVKNRFDIMQTWLSFYILKVNNLRYFLGFPYFPYFHILSGLGRSKSVPNHVSRFFHEKLT